MSVKVAKKGKLSPDEKAVRDLNVALGALKGTQHNPVDWVAITRYIGPIVARIAARYATRLIAKKLGKKLKSGVPLEVADETAEHIIRILTRSVRAATKVTKK